MMTQYFRSKKQTSMLLLTAILISAALLSGCSKGGGSQAADSPPLSATVSATVAASGELKLGAVGAATNLIAGMDLRVNLPAGVTVDADPATGDASTAVTISGAAVDNGLLAAKYAPASGTAPATVHIIVINAAGFHPGEFATIRFNLAEGTSLPAVGAFVITNFSAKGPDSSALSGIIAAPLSVHAAGNAAAKNKAQAVVTGDQNFLTISYDTPTKNSSQTITGTLFPGDLLVISTNTTATVSAPTITGGTWSAQVSGLVEGPNIIAVTETDAFGNTVASVSTTAPPLILDTKAPDLTVNNVLATIDSFKEIDGTVDDLPLRIVEVQVHCNTANADIAVVAVPFWSAMIRDLSYGDNHCTITATDAAGNQTSKDAHIYYDNILPDLEIHVIDKIKFGYVQTVTGTKKSGSYLTMTVNGIPYANTITDNGATWSCQMNGLRPGDNIISVTARDQYGRVTTKTATITTYVCNGSFSGASQPHVEDALKALRFAAGLDVPIVEDILHGDVFDDGLNHIDVADAILILKHAVGLFDNDFNFDYLLQQILY